MFRHEVVGLMYTHTCPLSCRDCVVESSPKAKGKMDIEVARRYLPVIRNYADVVCFTGGEPLLYYNEVVPLIREAREIGLAVTLVTGAGWARVEKRHIAKERLYGLKEAGLQTICISWDVYHEEWCAPEIAMMVIDLAKETGMEVQVRGVLPASGAIPRIEERLIQIQVDYQKVPVVRLGAAKNLPDDHFKFMPEAQRGPCNVIYSPVIEPNGTVYACCGPSRGAVHTSPLHLGNTNEEDLDTILFRAARDPFLEALAVVGPHGMFELIKDDPRIQSILPRRDRYTGICELCRDITDTVEVAELLRERFTAHEIRALLVAARMYQDAPDEMKTTFTGTIYPKRRFKPTRRYI